MNEQIYWQARRVTSCTRTSISTVFRLMTLPRLISPAGWLSTQISHHVIFPLIAYFRQRVTGYYAALGMHSTEWVTITFQNAASGLILVSWTLLQTLILWLHLPIQLISRLLHRWLANCWIPAIHAYICDVTHCQYNGQIALKLVPTNHSDLKVLCRSRHVIQGNPASSYIVHLKKKISTYRFPLFDLGFCEPLHHFCTVLRETGRQGPAPRPGGNHITSLHSHGFNS